MGGKFFFGGIFLLLFKNILIINKVDEVEEKLTSAGADNAIMLAHGHVEKYSIFGGHFFRAFDNFQLCNFFKVLGRCICLTERGMSGFMDFEVLEPG